MVNPELEHGRFSELPDEELTDEEKKRLKQATAKRRLEQSGEKEQEGGVTTINTDEAEEE